VTQAADRPLTLDEGVGLIHAVGIGLQDPVAVAVSGGPDSMALLALADRWARVHRRALLVLTVDHGLRANAADEAAAVAASAARLGHRHETLRWTGAKPTAGLQAAARAARLSLLTQACHAAGAGDLLLAHHSDDQAETVLHRIERESGPEGLAGMAPVSVWRGVHLRRPLLAIPKSRLVATCEAAGIAYASDPSNDDPRFTRTDYRRMRPALDAAGLTVERLTRLAAAMAGARVAMETAVEAWLARHATVAPCGTVSLGRAPLAAAPAALRSSVLRAALRLAGGEGYPPGSDAMGGLDRWVTAAPAPRRRTLAGCLIERAAENLVVMREVAACAPPRVVDPGATDCWDGRFLVRNRASRPLRIGACGEVGWRRLRLSGRAEAVSAASAGVPHAARLAWPAVTDLDGVVVLPHLVLGERRVPGQTDCGVDVRLLASRARRIDGPLANGRLTT